jgi:hypothetical protein
MLLVYVTLSERSVIIDTSNMKFEIRCIGIQKILEVPLAATFHLQSEALFCGPDSHLKCNGTFEYQQDSDVI